MKAWQKLMIAFARSERLKAFMQRRARASALAGQFVGGADNREAVQTARRLRDGGVRASLFYLGEYVRDAETVRATVENNIALAGALSQAGLDVHISVDPTQIGYSIDAGRWEENAWRLGQAVAGQPPTGRNCLMLDMEDFSVVQPTLAMHRRLREAGIPAALTLQAYLRRSGADLQSLLEGPNVVRLVKGAFAERRERAWQRRREIDQAYLHLAAQMLSPTARGCGFYPVFGTHDDRIIARIRVLAAANGWAQGQYEFEMLYGVRPALLHGLRDAGETVRVYLPYGRDWWPYAIRRVGETPRNALFAARALWSALTQVG